MAAALSAPMMAAVLAISRPIAPAIVWSTRTEASSSKASASVAPSGDAKTAATSGR
jgi:hypothetical protein